MLFEYNVIPERITRENIDGIYDVISISLVKSADLVELYCYSTKGYGQLLSRKRLSPIKPAHVSTNQKPG